MLKFLFPNTFSDDDFFETILRNQKSREFVGEVSDDEKLFILKKQLFVQTREGIPNLETRKAIECLTEIKDSEARERNSFFNQLTAFMNSLILIALTATAGSFLLTGTICKQSNSQMCRDARVMPDAIAKYLTDSKGKTINGRNN